MASDDRPAFETFPPEAIEDLARHVLPDPVPSGLVDRCAELFTWRTIDGELAELVADATWAAASGTRTQADRATLTFASNGYLVEVDVVPGAGLVGHVTPSGGVVVRVESPGGAAEAAFDETGRFRLPAVPTPPFRLVVIGTADQVLVRTRWMAA